MSSLSKAYHRKFEGSVEIEKDGNIVAEVDAEDDDPDLPKPYGESSLLGDGCCHVTVKVASEIAKTVAVDPVLFNDIKAAGIDAVT